MQAPERQGQETIEEEIEREERAVGRVVKAGGAAVTITTLAALGLLVVSADQAWQYLTLAMLGGVPLLYALGTTAVTRRMQKSLLERYQDQIRKRLSELEETASRDELTGLRNRRYFYQVLTAEIERCQTSKEPLALIIMDMDKLKTINDEYGHRVGDAVIAGLGRAIATLTRATDVAARLGGDEFGIVMPGTDKRGAFTLAQRLMEHLERTPMYEEGATRVMASVSIGVSGFPWGGESVEELIQWADADMYANKVSRRLPPVLAKAEEVRETRRLPDADDFITGF